MYELSSFLHSQPLVEQYLELHAYRYKFFVDTSPRGRHCRYAKLTIQHYEQDEEAPVVRAILRALTVIPSRLEHLEKLL
jgi:hypothetical protein